MNVATPTKQTRRAEYEKAEAHVHAVYDKKSPPYSDADLAGMMEAIGRLAPNVNLDREWLDRLLQRLQERKPEIHVRPRTAEEWQVIFPRYPTTGDGFVKSFEPDDHEAVRSVLRKYGLVVVKAFSEQVCNATINSMFEEINQLAAADGKTTSIDPNQPWTWDDRNWPSGKSKFLVRQPALHPQAFRNRVAPHLYQLFSQLWGEEKLRVSIDNWGITRGSRNLLLCSEQGQLERCDKPRWGKGIKPHWDYNPWLFANETETHGRDPGYQAVVALNEHRAGMGCHQTLPGGAAFLAQWSREHGNPLNLNLKRTSHRPKDDDEIRQYMQEIPLRQGEMIIWSWGQLHATASNDSDSMRLHQYIRMFPASEADASYELYDRYAPRRVRRQYDAHIDYDSIQLDDLGRRLLGLAEWPATATADPRPSA